MLNLVGIGLFDERDLTLKALDALRASEKVYLEGYTSYFNGDLDRLKELIGKDVEVLGRADIEENPTETVLSAGEVSLLVLGDPLAATTHTDLMLRAREVGVKVRVLHNASVFSAIGETGLQIYKFGRTTTIAYPDGSYFPKSPYEVVKENKLRGLHTLCLLDVRADERRYMTVNEGLELLRRMEHDRMQNTIRDDTEVVGVARLGGDVRVFFGKVGEAASVDYGGPPHCLIVCGKLHEMEREYLSQFRI